MWDIKSKLYISYHEHIYLFWPAHFWDVFRLYFSVRISVASSVFKGRMGAFPAPVLIIGPSVWFLKHSGLHISPAQTSSRSLSSRLLHKSDVVSLPPFQGEGGGESSLPLAVPDLFKAPAAEFGDVAALAGMKLHCFHFLNPAAIKEGERVGARCSRRFFARTRLFFFFLAKPFTLIGPRRPLCAFFQSFIPTNVPW